MPVNLIPVQQLSDEDLIREVESIPQILRQKTDLRNETVILMEKTMLNGVT